MKFKELVGLIYGVFMGTSTIYVKPPRSYKFPEKTINLDSKLVVKVGGFRNQVSFDGDFSIDASDRRHSISTYPTTDQRYKYSPQAGPFEQWIESENQKVKVISLNSRNLVVWIPDSQVLILGDLFYNCVHPPMKELESPLVGSWIQLLEELRAEYKPRLFIPAEGPPAEDLSEFLDYLTDLRDKEKTHTELLIKYKHFLEIVGTSSFTENFDYQRR